MRLLTKLAAAAGSFNVGWLSKGSTLQALKDAFLLECPPRSWGSLHEARDRQSMERAVRYFVEIIGDKDVKRISEADVQRYVDVLQQVPLSHFRRGHPEPIMEAVARNNEAAEPEPTVSPKAVLFRWLSMIARLMDWAQARGDIPLDPTVEARKELYGRIRAADAARLAAKRRLRAARYMEDARRQSGKASSADEEHLTPPTA